MPPRWVIEMDDRLDWPVKQSLSVNSVFILYDLVDHNILVDVRTLVIRALVDGEEAGYFPKEMQQWQFNREGPVSDQHGNGPGWSTHSSLDVVAARNFQPVSSSNVKVSVAFRSFRHKLDHDRSASHTNVNTTIKLLSSP